MYLDTQKCALTNEMLAHYQCGSGPEEIGSEEPPHKSHLDCSVRRKVGIQCLVCMYLSAGWPAFPCFFCYGWFLVLLICPENVRFFGKLSDCQNNYSLTTF